MQNLSDTIADTQHGTEAWLTCRFPWASLGWCLFSLGITASVARWIGGASIGLPAIVRILPIASLFFLLALFQWGKNVRRSLILKAATCLFIYAIIVILVRKFGFHFQQYGDSGSLEQEILAGRAYPRWFLGSYILSQLFNASLFFGVLQPTSASAAAFVATGGSSMMLLSSFLVAYFFYQDSYQNSLQERRSGPRAISGGDNKRENTCEVVRTRSFHLSGTLCLLQPMWLLFLSGYSEYYPFIAGPLVLSVLWCFRKELPKRSPLATGLLMSFLGLLYVGFVPISLCIGLALCAGNVRSGVKAFCVALAVTAVISYLILSQGLLQFLGSLRSELNFDRHAPGLDSSLIVPHLNIFAPNAFFSVTYWDVHWYLLFFSGALMPALVSAALAVWGSAGLSWAHFKNYSQSTLFVLLILFATAHFWLVVPLLGVRQDIDLYFQSYLLFALGAGVLFENGRFKLSISDVWYRKIKECFIAAYIGHSAVITYVLLLRGLPRVS